VKVPGARAALIRSYREAAEVIDPRLLFMDIPADELAAVNREQCHWRSMTDMADRLEAGEFIAVSARRVRDLPDVCEAMSWLSDRRLDSRTGVSVGTDDVIRRAPASAKVHW
jgi:ABC-type molybdenum transport system ATPase subunit/photorepair protein PhrA